MVAISPMALVVPTQPPGTLRSRRWLPAGTGALRGDKASPTPSAFHGHTLGTPPALGSGFASVC